MLRAFNVDASGRKVARALAANNMTTRRVTQTEEEGTCQAEVLRSTGHSASSSAVVSCTGALGYPTGHHSNLRQINSIDKYS